MGGSKTQIHRLHRLHRLRIFSKIEDHQSVFYFLRKHRLKYNKTQTRVDTPVLTGRVKPVILVNFQWPKTGFFEAKKPVIFISKIPQFELIFAIFSEKNHFPKIKHFFLKLILVKIWLVEAFTSNKTIRFTSILNVGK